MGKVISVTREGVSGQEHGMNSDDEDEDDGEDDEDTETSMIASIFDSYATGNYRGQKLFMRFLDLPRFAEDLCDIMPNKVKHFQKFSGPLENLFEDTLQLQQDFGTRTSKGLTLKWFEVFIQRAARKVGCSIIGLLFAMVDDTA